jgi:hypothetical protein
VVLLASALACGLDEVASVKAVPAVAADVEVEVAGEVKCRELGDRKRGGNPYASSRRLGMACLASAMASAS